MQLTVRTPRAVEAARTGKIGARQTTAIVLTVAAVIAAALVAAVPQESVVPRIEIAVVSLLLAAASSVLFVADRDSTPFGLRRIQLTPWLIAGYALSFGILSLDWTKVEHPGSSSIISRVGVPASISAASFGLLALTLGFMIGPSRLVTRWFDNVIRWAAPPGEWRLRVPSMAIVVYLIGLGARLAHIARGGYAYLGNAAHSLSDPSSLTQGISILEQLARFGLILAALDAVVISQSVRARVVFRAVLLTELGFALASGVKAELVWTLLAVAVAYTAGRGRISRRAVIAGALLFLILVPLNLAYRQQIVSASSAGAVSPLNAVRHLPQLVLDTYRGKSASTTLSGSTNAESVRLREIDNLALIMERSPSEIPFRSPLELGWGPVAGLVPRALWRSKPVLSTGYAFSQQYYNLPADLFTASAVTIPGDLYRHGGMLVLIAGMTVFGMILKAVERSCRPYDDVRLCLFYGAFFILLTNFESDVVSTTVSVVQLVIVVGLLTRFAFVPAKS